MKEEIGSVIAYDIRKGWGFLDSNGNKVFFHIANSPDFRVALGMRVRFEFAPPFKLGNKEQAVNLRQVAETFATGVLDAQKTSGKAGA